ncbi:right-handed parallel beta-helix repeat-containing protein [Lentzea sp. NBRC 102530]|uniref:right-handed parallel beta-helix repeat-containing protein n=1 Tax=Lentzea sp. NBRC 102530 TaxID=3032201 RepID=UPI002556A72E|nr:right-handed parallel beta-helix repeat-containing protein [Lentzea sp. NBRC 102530]
MRAPYAFAAVLLFAGCSPTTPDLGAEITVPAQFGTIQAAVDAAREGATILVSPGVYKESVEVRTKALTIRGLQRGSVIIDGEVKRASGIVLSAPDVSVQNLTVRNHTENGVAVTRSQGFRISYVTASNNALHGVHATDAQHGVIEQSYASGSADSGFYVGQCKPCDVVVRGNVAERNAVGYEGVNASGRMFVLGNRFSDNRVGVTTNAEDATFVGNLVSDNAEALSPAQADGAFGLGFGIVGGTKNLVARNLITRNPGVGVALGSAEDLAPMDNRFFDNVITGNGQDVLYAASRRAPGRNNCFDRERCYDGVGDPLPRSSAPRGIPFNQVASPPLQPEMPDGPLPEMTPNVDKYVLPSHPAAAPTSAAVG